MIVSNTKYHAEPDIQVRLYTTTKSKEPFLVDICDGTTLHISLADAQRLSLQLTAALYEYDNDYPYKESE